MFDYLVCLSLKLHLLIRAFIKVTLSAISGIMIVSIVPALIQWCLLTYKVTDLKLCYYLLVLLVICYVCLMYVSCSVSCLCSYIEI